MACNCASSEQIKLLYAKYGNKKDTKKLTPKERVKYYVQYTGVSVAMLIVLPFLILYVLYKGLFDDNKRISIRKLFNLKTNLAIDAK